ncbi:hypothetical protein AA313_de0203062 [Arthrobotrys entomopaga]|nr:hypothetical protein AA313_de0203062 [Arthrobotrys entomopaga]
MFIVKGMKPFTYKLGKCWARFDRTTSKLPTSNISRAVIQIWWPNFPLAPDLSQRGCAAAPNEKTKTLTTETWHAQPLPLFFGPINGWMVDGWIASFTITFVRGVDSALCRARGGGLPLSTVHRLPNLRTR